MYDMENSQFMFFSSNFFKEALAQLQFRKMKYFKSSLS